MKYLALLLVALFVSASLAGPIEKRRSVRASGGVGFSSSNVTLSNENTYDYRATSLTEINFFTVNILFYMAVSVSGEGDENQGSVDASGVFGLAYIAPNIAPTLWAAFAESNMQYSSNNLPKSPDEIKMEGSASLALTVYEKIEEIDSNGNVVKTIDLAKVGFVSSGIKKVDGGGVPGALSYVTYTGTSEGAEISVTIVTSNIVGKLEVGATVTPQCLEAIFEIDGYTYADQSNFLRLSLFGGVGSLSKKLHVSGNVLVSGSDLNAPYVLLGADVLVGENADETSTEVVIVAKWKDIEVDDLPLTGRTAVNGVASQGIAFSAKTTTVDFPAGFKFISYDPQIGFNVPGSAATLIPSLAILLAVVAAFLKF